MGPGVREVFVNAGGGGRRGTGTRLEALVCGVEPHSSHQALEAADLALPRAQERVERTTVGWEAACLARRSETVAFSPFDTQIRP